MTMQAQTALCGGCHDAPAGLERFEGRIYCRRCLLTYALRLLSDASTAVVLAEIEAGTAWRRRRKTGRGHTRPESTPPKQQPTPSASDD